MLAFPSMLISAAEQAGIKHPPEEVIDTDDWNKDEYPHWHILCVTQLGRAMDHGEHFENAKMLAKIPTKKLKTMTVEMLQDAGVNCGS